MNMIKCCLPMAISLALMSNSYAGVLPDKQKNDALYSNAEAQLTLKQALQKKYKAKNVILFVGDGMGISTLTAARILKGQQTGNTGEEGYLSFEKFLNSAEIKTYNVDAQTPDSAGTMTAMMTGVKSDAGVIAISEAVERGNCASAKNHELVTALELAEIKGLSTGIVTTARITHATPAATYAHSAERNWEDVSDMSDEAVSNGCEDIASQLVNFEKNIESRYLGVDVNGIEVAMGGGRRHFLPKDAAFNSSDAQSAIEGDRTDNRDLTAEWQAKYPTGKYVIDQAGFDSIDVATTDKVFGLFNESHMQYEADRANDIAGEPSLSQMTGKAIDILAKNTQGYFLMVESGRIDHGHHAGSAYNALTEAVEFSNAVQAAVDKVNSDDTLILVTADHSHVFTIAGYPKRGNPILGKVISVGATETAKADDGMPYTTLGYNNGLGYRDLGSETNADVAYDSAPSAGRQDITTIDTTMSGYHQETTVPLSSETHAGEDVSLHASGPGAQLAQGVMEQNMVFHLINQSLDLIKE